VNGKPWRSLRYHSFECHQAVFDNIKSDFSRYLGAPGAKVSLGSRVSAAMTYGFLATLVYRYGRWTRTIEPRVLSLPFKLLYKVLAFWVDVLFGINISTNANIGKGLYIGHFGGIFLHGDMGEFCSVGQGVTIGYKGAGKSTRAPTIGSHVYIGTSAVIIGDITIGDHVLIGANTTVTKDVPAHHRVVSQPVRMTPR
jgi:serine O-acetyltransferase